MKDKFSKTKIWGGKYHLLDLQESINNLADEFHKQIPVDNDDDLQELWNTVSKCCQKFIDDIKKKHGGDIVFVAMTVDDYELMSYNTQEIKRYINQLGEVIVYYRNVTINEEPAGALGVEVE